MIFFIQVFFDWQAMASDKLLRCLDLDSFNENDRARDIQHVEAMFTGAKLVSGCIVNGDRIPDLHVYSWNWDGPITDKDEHWILLGEFSKENVRHKALEYMRKDGSFVCGIRIWREDQVHALRRVAWGSYSDG